MPKDLQVAMKEWQEALRLQDWDITAKVLDRKEYDFQYRKGSDNNPDDTLGWNHISRWDMTSKITIAEDSPDKEDTLVHEEVHLLLDGLDGLLEQAISMCPSDQARQVLNGSKIAMLEKTVNNVTRALLKVRDMAQEAPKETG